MPASDGAGVKLNRVIGGRDLPQLDPFLLLDEFRSDDAADYLAGFPEHPHRGFETVTYMLAGRMRHRDNQGNTGLLGPGAVQWMTAGRGIVHSEMPEQENGLMQGFQLWVNLPAKDKMIAPRYQDIEPARIPEVAIPGGRVRVIAGSFGGASGPVQADATAPLYLDVFLKNGEFQAAVPVEHNAFAYIYDGSLDIAGRTLKRGELAVLSSGDAFAARAGDAGARFILVAGRPLKEPVARYGPFVMNRPEEIQQAMRDFTEGRLG
ncbi:MAG TPA: pirin family protein [Burkholderiales bacterium]|nr:pirin family protein [Burkholderiales bacterium]